MNTGGDGEGAASPSHPDPKGQCSWVPGSGLRPAPE